MPIGQATLSSNSVLPTRVSADGRPDYKVAGVTLDWSTVTALAADATYPDGSVVLSGQKVLRYGQVLCRIGVAEIQTYELTGGPTAGTATVTFAATSAYAAESFTIAFNATGAAVQASLQALNRFGANGVTVARTGAGSAGDPYIYTATYNKSAGDVSTPTGTHTFTGGTTPTITIATGTAAGSSAGKFGPYDPAATDGRATLARGECYILDETVLQYGAGTSLLSQSTDHYGSCVEGGLLWRDRVLHSGTQTHTLARGPTLAEVETAFPNVRWVASQT